LAAPYYVPILFGDGWDDISDIVSILCLVAIPTTLWTAAAGWMRANERPDIELLVTSILTVGVVLNTIVLAPFGLTTVATGYAITATIIMVIASIPAMTTAFAANTVEA
jgi:PST family polysaccharide transporter